MALSLGMLAQIRASPTMIWGWFDLDEMKAWKDIFPLPLESRKIGWLPLSDLVWMEWANRLVDILIRQTNEGGSVGV